MKRSLGVLTIIALVATSVQLNADWLGSRKCTDGTKSCHAITCPVGNISPQSAASWIETTGSGKNKTCKRCFCISRGGQGAFRTSEKRSGAQKDVFTGVIPKDTLVGKTIYVGSKYPTGPGPVRIGQVRTAVNSHLKPMGLTVPENRGNKFISQNYGTCISYGTIVGCLKGRTAHSWTGATIKCFTGMGQAAVPTDVQQLGSYVKDKKTCNVRVPLVPSRSK